MEIHNLSPSKERIFNDIETLATFIDPDQPQYTRRAFSPNYTLARKWLKETFEQVGLTVTLDATANLIGTRQGQQDDLPPIMIGSHTDTVYAGGRFDGIAGVIAGLEVVRLLNEHNIHLRHPLKIVDFLAEEPTDFGLSTVGSRGMTGKLTPEQLQLTDLFKTTLAENIDAIGGNTAEIQKTALKKGDLSLYLELHIEQGPLLEKNKAQIGIVSGIVQIDRRKIIVTGDQNHAGTTPMADRKDALAAAAEIVLFIENHAKTLAHKDSFVGTVGKINVSPNSSNVIAGNVEMEYELRAMNTDLIQEMQTFLESSITKISENKDVSIDIYPISTSKPVLIDRKIQEIIRKASAFTDKIMTLPSGAGHDANHLACICPVGMIFVPSKDGKSHCPEEFTSSDDLAAGIKALAGTLILADQQLK